MPEVVVIVLGVRIQMEPQLDHMMRQKAHDEDNDERDDHAGDVAAGPGLRAALRARILARHFPCARVQPVRHQHVQYPDDGQWQEVVND